LRGVRRAHSHNARALARRKLGLEAQPKAPVLASARQYQAEASDGINASMPAPKVIANRICFMITPRFKRMKLKAAPQDYKRGPLRNALTWS